MNIVDIFSCELNVEFSTQGIIIKLNHQVRLSIVLLFSILIYSTRVSVHGKASNLLFYEVLQTKFAHSRAA